MENTIHTKYRPETFDDVVGQKSVVSSLQNALADGSCRSFIFTGPSGVGKTTLARILAKSVGCPAANLIEIDAATFTGIDAMRGITETLSYSPLTKNKKRVVIIDEAHALSKAAWNSLLKSVEEPNETDHWVFCTTEPEKIPKTIYSRCLDYRLSTVRVDILFDLLVDIVVKEGLDVNDNLLTLAAEEAEGSPRNALTNLAKIEGCKNVNEASAILRASGGEDGDEIKLCRLLVKGELTWKKALPILNSLKGSNPESLRIRVCAYLTTVLLGTKDEKRAATVCGALDCFVDPYPANSGSLAPFALSVSQFLFEE